MASLRAAGASEPPPSSLAQCYAAPAEDRHMSSETPGPGGSATSVKQVRSFVNTIPVASKAVQGNCPV